MFYLHQHVLRNVLLMDKVFFHIALNQPFTICLPHSIQLKFGSAGVTLATAGSVAAFVVTARDAFHNDRGLDEDSWYFFQTHDEDFTTSR